MKINIKKKSSIQHLHGDPMPYFVVAVVVSSAEFGTFALILTACDAKGWFRRESHTGVL